jgi:hypothetical protein
MNVASPARILICSPRVHEPVISRCGTIEFEDVVCELDTVALRPSGSKPVGGRIQRGVGRALINALGTRSSAGPYDLFFASVHTSSDLARIPGLWRHLKRARFAACNIDEVWAKSIPHHQGDFPLLRAFDHLFTMCHGSVEALASAVGRPCTYLPPSIDALRFAPPEAPFQRVIDLHLMGRRRQDLHQALLDFARETGRFYLYDTVQFSPRVTSASEHRQRLADLLQRTHAFMVDVSNADLREKTGGQLEFGPRYVEGAAAGAVLIGTAPDTKAFAEQFGWPDSVVPTEANAASIRGVFEALEDDPERTARIRRANVKNVLLRHDVAHRWEQILGTFGLAPLPQMQARKERLARAAERIAASERIAEGRRSCSA